MSLQSCARVSLKLDLRMRRMLGDVTPGTDYLKAFDAVTSSQLSVPRSDRTFSQRQACIVDCLYCKQTSREHVDVSSSSELTQEQDAVGAR